MAPVKTESRESWQREHKRLRRCVFLNTCECWCEHVGPGGLRLTRVSFEKPNGDSTVCVFFRNKNGDKTSNRVVYWLLVLAELHGKSAERAGHNVKNELFTF